MDYKIKLIDDFFKFCRHTIDDVTELKPFLSTQIISQNFMGKEVGLDSVKELHNYWSQSFLQESCDTKYTSFGDSVVTAEWNVVAVHRGAFNGVQASGKKIYYSGNNVFHFENKKIVKYYYANLNFNSIYKQLGLFLDKELYLNQNTIKRDYHLLIKALKDGFANYNNNLSTREIECLSLFLKGFSAKTIGFGLECSYRTIQNHLGNAMDKLSCSSKNQLFELVDYLQLLPVFKDLGWMLIDRIRANKNSSIGKLNGL